MKRTLLLIASVFIAIGAMAQILGVNNIPTERVNPSNGLQTGYYLLKQVNGRSNAAGGLGVGWIRAASEASDASVTSKNTGTPSNNDARYIWYVEVEDAENNLITISTANKVAAWQTPWKEQKNLVAYNNKATLKYHAGSVDLSNDSHSAATPDEGSFFISDQNTTAFVHFSGDNLGSWYDTNISSMFMVEFYKLSDEELVKAFTLESGKLYRIKNRCIDLTHIGSDENAIDMGDGNGAYMSSTKGENGTRWNNETRFTDCNTTSLADAGCVWKLISDNGKWKIQNANNGMYIANTRGGSNDRYVQFTTENSDKVALFNIEKNSDGYYTFTDASYQCAGGNSLHASAGGLQVWAASAKASQWEIIPAEELELTIGAGGYSTMNFAFPVKLAGASDGKVGLMGYVAGEDNGTSIELFDAVISGSTDGSENVPANTPLIVQGTEGATYTLQILNEEVTNHPNQAYLNYNSLSGTLMPLSFEAGHGKNIYGIATVDGKTKFYKMTSGATTIGKNKAYYEIPASSAAPAKLNITFGDNTTTNISNAVNEENVLDKVYYDLNGRRVFYPTRGIYVTGSGKKVFVK